MALFHKSYIHDLKMKHSSFKPGKISHTLRQRLPVGSLILEAANRTKLMAPTSNGNAISHQIKRSAAVLSLLRAWQHRVHRHYL